MDVQQHQDAKIIAFTGPKEGVGKTTIALNLAMAWAGVQKRNVLIIPFDPLARQEHSFFFKSRPPSVSDLTKVIGAQSLTLVGSLLKGKIPISQWGVGVLPLAYKRSDIERISPKILLPLLLKLSQSFDLFLDVECNFPMQTFAFDISDAIFWITNPTHNNLNATANLFSEYKEQHFPLDRFEVICNNFDIPGSIDPKEVSKFFKQLQKKVLTFLPWSETISTFSNQLKMEIVENPNSPWIKGLKLVLDKVLELPPIEKAIKTTVSDEEFIQAARNVWSAKVAPVSTGGQSVLSEIGSEEDPSVSRRKKTPYWDSLKQKLHTEVVKSLEMDHVRITDEGAKDPEVRKKVAATADDLLQKEPNLQLGRESRIKFINELLDEILGLGPLEELMRDKSVTEIMVNAPDKVFIEKSGKLILTPYQFRDEDHIVQVIKRIVAPLGRRIDESVSLVDARLKDGSRVNAIIPPLAVSGPTLTIRRFSEKPFGPEEYYKFGTINKEAMGFLRACVLLRKDIIISGGTGTGKTTFLNALSGYIPSGERIITVEDTAELKLQQPHWVRLESRPPNVEGKGEVTIRDLVKNCLRMRPDRIVVGECRGAEALDMLQAMNTGHEGSLATIHANTPKDALTRLEAMCLMAGAELPIWALREMICSAVHLVVQLTRFADGSRKVTHITEVTGRQETSITTQDLFRYVQTGVDEDGKVVGRFYATGNLPTFYSEFESKGIKVPKEIFRTDKEKQQTVAKEVKSQ
jgi:Flp pilus assembly CpaF family ATPase/MinD-like ATPase involved in chromosome partitioning or flagellar assembly